MEKPTTTRWIPFDPKHLDLLVPLEGDTDHVFKLSDATQRLETLGLVSREAGTCIYDGRVLCFAGFYNQWPGVAEGWIIPSCYIKQCPMVYCREIKRYIEAIMDSFKLHRFSTVAKDSAVYKRWMEFLGFEFEGRLKKYTSDGQTFCAYAKVR